MGYIITGGTGFIGRFFLEQLEQREGTIYSCSISTLTHNPRFSAYVAS